jgi:hypothetical protein
MTELLAEFGGPGTTAGGLLSPYDASALFEPYTERRVRLRLDPRLAGLRLGAETARVELVLRGFAAVARRLAAQGKSPWSFGMIGPGSGAEAIGAAHVFRSLRHITVTDRDPLILAEAASNIRRHVDAGIDVTSHDGNIFAPLATVGRRVDLLYANLLNIPFTAAPEAVIDRCAYCPPVARTAHDELLNTYRLGLHFFFLRAAPAALTERGVVLASLGGRFPYGVFNRLAEAAGMRFEEISSALQLQTDADNVLNGCASAEIRGEEFDFYEYDGASACLAGRGACSGAALKSLLTPYRLSAQAALRAHLAGRSVGHTAHLMLATPIRHRALPPLDARHEALPSDAD